VSYLFTSRLNMHYISSLFTASLSSALDPVLYFGASAGVLKHMFALGYRLPAFKSWTELIEVRH
jgi:hypothetical protein